MLNDARKLAWLPWVAMGFCACLSIITVAANLWLTVNNGVDTGGWAIPFLCFLPLCFFFMGAAVVQLRSEVAQLQERLEQMSGREE